LKAETGALPSTLAVSDRGVMLANARARRAPRDGVTRLGDQLRAARERRKTVLEQVSEETRIQLRYLEALERHDWECLPADVFTRGYLRTYAQYLGLDPEHLLKAYARERRIAGFDDASLRGRDAQDAARAFLEKLAQQRGIEARRVGRIKRIVLGLSGAGAAALLLWTFLHRTPGEVPHRVERTPSIAPLALAVAPRPPEPSPPPQPPAPAGTSAGHLTVGESGVGTSVIHHRLVGRGNQFREGTVVWFWTYVVGGRPGDKIRHVWLHGGRSIAEAELNVNTAQWRTQSRRPLPEGSTGEWTVEARDAEGRLIASAAFTCLPAE
jgi:hypothetical protein